MVKGGAVSILAEDVLKKMAISIKTAYRTALKANVLTMKREVKEK